MLKEIVVPDIGSYSNVEIIEVLVKEGETIAKDASLITLETDKATMEIPSPYAGIIKSLRVKMGDKVSAGDLILSLETDEKDLQPENKNNEDNSNENTSKKDEGRDSKDKESKDENFVNKEISQKSTTSNKGQQKRGSVLKEVIIPDIGAYSNVDVIEILVKEGDRILREASMITLETDKATLEIPSPFEGTVKSLKVKLGDKVSAGDVILILETTETIDENNQSNIKNEPEPSLQKSVDKASSSGQESVKEASSSSQNPVSANKSSAYSIPHAGPGVRRFARELGVDLREVQGSGRKDRILQVDVQQYVKKQLQRLQSGNGRAIEAASGPSLFGHLPTWPDLNYAEFGPIEKEPLSRIKKLSGNYLHRNWLMVPHVTQFDEADITDLEQFRKESQSLAEEGVKLTPLVFIMKAVTAALAAFPNFNASLDVSGSTLIKKKYFHIGVAVDTPNGLVVPVVQNVDKKGLFQLAKELAEISQKARKGQLTAKEMQGSSFSISSLGGVGGTAFTPIINVPDVAILGVSRSQIKPIYQEGEFKPRLMLPLSLSYDHRVIDGAEAARFSTYLVKQLSDLRRLLL